MHTTTGFKSYQIPIINTNSPNVVAQTQRSFHLSYLPYTGDYGSDTTALVLDNNVFLILNGDHKKELLTMAQTQGLAGCIKYFTTHITEANQRSEHRMAVLLDEDPFGLNKTVQDLLEPTDIASLRQASEAL